MFTNFYYKIAILKKKYEKSSCKNLLNI